MAYENYSIISLLQSHPVSLKENLQNICNALELTFDPKDTKTHLTVQIETLLLKETVLKSKVREIAVTMMVEHEK